MEIVFFVFIVLFFVFIPYRNNRDQENFRTQSTLTKKEQIQKASSPSKRYDYSRLDYSILRLLDEKKKLSDNQVVNHLKRLGHQPYHLSIKDLPIIQEEVNKRLDMLIDSGYAQKYSCFYQEKDQSRMHVDYYKTTEQGVKFVYIYDNLVHKLTEKVDNPEVKEKLTTKMPIVKVDENMLSSIISADSLSSEDEEEEDISVNEQDISHQSSTPSNPQEDNEESFHLSYLSTIVSRDLDKELQEEVWQSRETLKSDYTNLSRERRLEREEDIMKVFGSILQSENVSIRKDSEGMSAPAANSKSKDQSIDELSFEVIKTPISSSKPSFEIIDE